jgi:histidine triad (HIT) family protein
VAADVILRANGLFWAATPVLRFGKIKPSCCSGKIRMSYDPQNIFARILRGEIPCNKVYEDDAVLAFKGIRPQAAEHVLVIPKGAFTDFQDFAENADDAEIAGYIRSVARVAREIGVVDSGYRLISNCGANAHQEVPHLHFHMFGGEPLGPLLVRKDG